MSSTYFLVCDETKKDVMVATNSSNGFHGAPHPQVVGAFCRAHQGKVLTTMEFEFLPMSMDVWTIYNVRDQYEVMAGIPLPHLIQRSPPDPDGIYYY